MASPSVPETSLRARVKDHEAHRFAFLARAYFPRYLAVPHGKGPKAVSHLGHSPIVTQLLSPWALDHSCTSNSESAVFGPPASPSPGRGGHRHIPERPVKTSQRSHSPSNGSRLLSPQECLASLLLLATGKDLRLVPARHPADLEVLLSELPPNIPAWYS